MSMSELEGRIFIDVGDVAKLLQTSPQAIYGIIGRRRMPASTRKEADGRTRHRIPVESLVQWVDERIAGTQRRLNLLVNARAKMMEALKYAVR